MRDPATAGWASTAVPNVRRWGEPVTFQIFDEIGICQRLVLSPRTPENMS